MANYRVISSDSHILEPAGLWADRVGPKFRDQAPRVIRQEDGYDWWYFEGKKIVGVNPGTQTGRRFEEPEKLSRNDVIENVRPGAYIPEEHVKDMDVDGVDVGLVYPTVGLFLYKVVDSELLTSVLSIYNDWIAEFSKPFPDRLKGLGMINTDDIQQGVKELERCAKLGLVGSMITSYYDGKAYDSPEYEVLWDAAEDLGMPLSPSRRHQPVRHIHISEQYTPIQPGKRGPLGPDVPGRHDLKWGIREASDVTYRCDRA